MLAMKRLPSDSFLPSGGLDSFDRSMASISNLNHRPDSVISPLPLPNSLRHPYFEPSNDKKLLPASYAVTSSSQQHLTSERQSLTTPTGGTTGSSVTSPSMAPTNPGVASPFDHLSPQATATLLQRREEYTRRLQENWQAERAHLEASRARAEEMFREERNMMDEERLSWIEQKTGLENEIMGWRQRTEAAEAEVAKLTKLINDARNTERKLGGRFDGAVDKVAAKRGAGSSDGSGTIGLCTSTFETPSDGISPGSLPPGRGSTIPESNPFVPLDPRMQSTSPNNTAHEKQERVPSIDINDVIPGLEGVRLKAPAIQKSTFSDATISSPTDAPCVVSPSNSRKGSSESQSKASPAVMTKEALLAPEHRRLTMHAGHTPNHSISLSQLPTVDSSAGNTAESSGTSTPTSPDGPKIARVGGIPDPSNLIPNVIHDNGKILLFGDEIAISEDVVFEPSDRDPALKGPLCLKNRPAADELFLRRLSDKLEEVRATDEAPAVLHENTAPGCKAAPYTKDDINGSQPEDTLEDVEEDIPLRLRKSSNFGQPLGQIRRTSGF
ncbi:hypothetical protein NUW58_g6481 [Xylaria curta]|uniref:Uncharacterized protein n=1 Tax=Xylaria curta TaxID=42375 RepID=A0ACC1NT03_9PEZI|nr:hypothetical protein NUW58_g6481 [Xylaria curta]